MNCYTTTPELNSCVLNKFLWYNKYVSINKKTAHFKRFSEHNIGFVMDI